MASYQNTNKYYCDVTMDSYPEHCTNPSGYFNQNPSNFQVHNVVYPPENYGKQEVYPVLSTDHNIYQPRRGGQVDYNNRHYYERSAPHYHLTQYTPLTPAPVSDQYTPLIPAPVSYPVFHPEPRPYRNNYCMAKRHRAQITILESSKGNFKAEVKRKRKRTIFTTEQVEALEKIFKTKQYISPEERQIIANNLQINDKAVKTWFQNRRLKTKRSQDQDSEEQDDCSNAEHSEEASSSPDVARLDSIESLISKKTNEYGFVTLDDEVMGDLASVIEEFLTKGGVHVPVEEIVGNDTSPIYEPISPASVCDSNEEENYKCWRPSEPSESLQRLFDLQSMFAL